MTARLIGLRPMLETPKLDATVEFWTDVLGFARSGSIEDDQGRLVWCELVRDSVRVMLTTHYHDDPAEDDDEDHQPSLTGVLYVDVDDVDGLAASLEGRVPLEFGPVDQPYRMREIGVRDPNGYMLLFGQNLPAGGEESG